jgi:hypothetical protein
VQQYQDVSVLVGVTLEAIHRSTDGDELVFICKDGRRWKMFHDQDCCESVTLEDVIGNLDDLTDAPILQAEEVSEGGTNDWGSYTWTFYKFATIKGYVTLRWYGESNGYYSEGVNFVEVKETY